MIRNHLVQLLLAAVAVPAWLAVAGCSTEQTQNKQSVQETAAAGDETEKQHPDKVSQPTPGPSEQLNGIFLPEKSYHFGAVPRGEKRTHNFVLRNTGDAPLRILKAKAG
jgi:hypothetical protein